MLVDSKSIIAGLALVIAASCNAASSSAGSELPGPAGDETSLPPSAPDIPAPGPQPESGQVDTAPNPAPAPPASRQATSASVPPLPAWRRVSGVKWQLGPGHWSQSFGEEPVINRLKLGSERNLDPLIQSGDFDIETKTYRAIPAGERDITVALVLAPGGPHFQGRWVLDWEGDGDMILQGQDSRIVSQRANRKIYEIGPNNRRNIIKIKNIGAAGIRNPRFYREADEALLNAGRVFNPHWIKLASRYQVLRPMDWLGANSNQITRVSDIPDYDMPTWARGNGIPPLAAFQAAMETGTELWFNAPNYIGAPVALKAVWASGSEQAEQRSRVARISAMFNEVDQSGEWLNYARYVVSLMEESGYPVERPFYLELGNEIWNWGFKTPNEYYWGMSEGLKSKTGNKYSGNVMRPSYGYLSAKLADAFAQALDEAGRSSQEWTMVIGARTTGLAGTTGALEGVRDFNGNVEMSRFGIATTGYYRGGFQYVRGSPGPAFLNAVNRDDYVAKWKALYNSGPDKLAAEIEAFMTDPRPRKQNVAYLVSITKEHEKIAKRFGAFYLGQYEGSSHDVVFRRLRDVPGIAQFHRRWHQGPHHAAVIAAHDAQMRAAFPNAILANYMHWREGGTTVRSPWVEGEIDKAPQAAEAELLRLIERR